MTEGTRLTVGQFVATMLAEKKRAVAEKRNAGGDTSIYPDIAREVLMVYPTITPEEKETVYGIFTQDAHSYPPHRMSAGVQGAARILGL
jgi:hypothetical protein